jgi:hypothetical protein
MFDRVRAAVAPRGSGGTPFPGGERTTDGTGGDGRSAADGPAGVDGGLPSSGGPARPRGGGCAVLGRGGGGADAVAGGGRAPTTTGDDDGRADVEGDEVAVPSSSPSPSPSPSLSARTAEDASDAPRPARESASATSPSPSIAVVDAAKSTSTTVGLVAARSKSPSSGLKTSSIAAVASKKNRQPFPRVPSFEAFEVTIRPKEKDHPATMQRRLLEATQTLTSHAAKKKKSPSADHCDRRVSVVASEATRGIELQLIEKGAALNDRPAFHRVPSSEGCDRVDDDFDVDRVTNVQPPEDEHRARKIETSMRTILNILRGFKPFSSLEQDRCQGSKDECSTDSPIGVDSFPSFAGMPGATYVEEDRSLDRMQPLESHAGRKKISSSSFDEIVNSRSLPLLDETSTFPSMNSSVPSVDSMSAIYSQDEHKMFQRMKCREKNIILVDYRSPSAYSAKSEITRDSTDSVRHMLRWDLAIPPLPEEDQQQQRANDCKNRNTLESAHEDIGIELQLVRETNTDITQCSKSSKVGRKMRSSGGNLFRDSSGPMIHHNLVDVDEVSVSVASQRSNGNIESLTGLHNLCSCFYGDYGDVIDDGDDCSSKGEVVEITGLDKLLNAINDSKLLVEYDDEFYSEWYSAVDDESLTYDCGESIAVEEGKDFNLSTKSSPPRPKEAVANMDATKINSVVFVAPYVDDPRMTIRLLTKA